MVLFLPRETREADHATAASRISLFGYTGDGTLLWQIQADSGRIEATDQTLENVCVDFYDADGPELSVRGDRLERASGVSRLTGAVRIERSGGSQMRLEALTWHEAAEQLAAGPVELSADRLTLSAAQFEYDLRTGSASFGGSVQVSVSWESTWIIRADRAEGHDDVTILRGGVVAESEEGESFRCESMEVDPASGTAFLSGGVVGEWPSGELLATSVRLDEEGIHAAGSVVGRVHLDLSEHPDDP